MLEHFIIKVYRTFCLFYTVQYHKAEVIFLFPYHANWLARSIYRPRKTFSKEAFCILNLMKIVEAVSENQIIHILELFF